MRPLAGGRAEIAHDWLAGTGEATLDSAHRLLRYSGARTTYLVDVSRVATPPDVAALAERFAAEETEGGGARPLSMRDTVRASVGGSALTVDYGRPLARGRTLLGGVIAYDRVWRAGANAATHFTTSAPITPAAPVERFTIAIDSAGAGRGTLSMSWGPFRWSAPIAAPITSARSTRSP